MTSRSALPLANPPSLIEQMVAKESAAAAVFESRWTLRALARVDPELRQNLKEQSDMFREALLLGEDEEIKEQGDAMCRGWAAAIQRMVQAEEPDDSYILGSDTKSGIQVAVSGKLSSRARVRDVHGERVIFLTADEVAAMFVGLQRIAEVKALWPGAEITEVRPNAVAAPRPVDMYADEPAQGDGEC